MNNVPREKPQGKRSLRVIIGVVAVLVLVVLAVCGGIIFLGIQFGSKLMTQGMSVVNQMIASQAVAQEFFTDLRNSKFDVAYARTSAQFQKKVSLEALRQYVDSQPALKKPASMTFDQVNINQSTSTKTGPGGIPDITTEGTRINLNAVLGTADGPMSCMLEMIREGDSWKIDKFRYAGKPLPPETAAEKK